MQSKIDTTESDGLCPAAVRDCYQCGKCSAGCPMAEQMDLLPNQLVRLVQLERIGRAVRSEAIWMCVSCMTCSARCPKSVDCAGVIDALRQRAVAEDAISPERRRVVLFQRAFLDNVRRNGRLCELSLVGAFKTKALLGDGNIPPLFQDGAAGAATRCAAGSSTSAANASATARWCGGFLKNAKSGI